LKKAGRKVAIPWAPSGPVLTPLNFILWDDVKIRNLAHLEEKLKRLLRYATPCMERSGILTGYIRTLRYTYGNLTNFRKKILEVFFNFVILIS